MSNATLNPIQFPRHATPFHGIAIPCKEWRGMACLGEVWSGGIGLGLELPFSTGIGVACREADGGTAGLGWRGVAPGGDLELARIAQFRAQFRWRGVA